jgi:hypothetical protein
MASDESFGEGERRAPRRGTLTLAQILDIFERDQDRHMTAGPATEEELARLESAIGLPLPAPLRQFLSRLGGGLFYNGHEIFGPLRAMVHDIELVPDMLSLRHRLMEERSLPEGFLPFHRARGVLNLIDAREAAGAGAIISLSEVPPHTDLASFLETVVLPRR